MHSTRLTDGVVVVGRTGGGGLDDEVDVEVLLVDDDCCNGEL